MTQFPSSAQLISWASFCPELRESAGKKKRTRIRKGAIWLEPVLVQAAWAGARRKDSYLRAQYGRLKTRRGAKTSLLLSSGAVSDRNAGAAPRAPGPARGAVGAESPRRWEDG